MLEFTEISMKDKELFDQYIAKFDNNASELNFTNLFMWRHLYGFRYAIDEGHIVVVSVPKKGLPFAFIPLGSLDINSFESLTIKLIEYFDSKGFEFMYKRIEEDKVELIKGFKTLKFTFEEDRDNSDYVYLSSDLINLKGKKYDGKRNHINKFLKSYSHEYVEITLDKIDDCKTILEKWCSERSCDEHSDFSCEKKANFELLNNYEALNLKGAMIYVDGVPEAFTVGEQINSNTAVIHIEKANSKINGLYTYINQQFCKNTWSDLEFINREQDLGIEGLRKAKLSYNPAKLINKYSSKLLV